MFGSVWRMSLKGVWYNKLITQGQDWLHMSLSLPMLHSSCLRLNQSLCFGIKKFFMMVIC